MRTTNQRVRNLLKSPGPTNITASECFSDCAVHGYLFAGITGHKGAYYCYCSCNLNKAAPVAPNASCAGGMGHNGLMSAYKVYVICDLFLTFPSRHFITRDLSKCTFNCCARGIAPFLLVVISVCLPYILVHVFLQGMCSCTTPFAYLRRRPPAAARYARRARCHSLPLDPFTYFAQLCICFCKS